jgi:hypothetical protein
MNDPSEAEVMAHSAGYAKALDDCDRADVAALIKERDVLRVDLAFERARRSTAERQRDDAQAHAAMLSEQRKADDEAFGRYMNDIKALADDKARLREALRPFAQTLERYRFGPNELLDITRANGERLNVLLAENFAAARTVLAAERTATGGEEIGWHAPGPVFYPAPAVPAPDKAQALMEIAAQIIEFAEELHREELEAQQRSKQAEAQADAREG